MGYFSSVQDSRRLVFAFTTNQIKEIIERANHDSIPDSINHLMPDFATELSSILRTRAQGAVVLHFGDTAYLQIMVSGIIEAIGTALPETRMTDGRAMAPTAHVAIPLQHQAGQVGRLKHFADPNLSWPLHTDRTLHDDVGDFLAVAKVQEENSVGGRIRLLHLDDFAKGSRFITDRLASTDLEWKGDVFLAPIQHQAELKKRPGVSAPVFSNSPFGLAIRFTDSRFRHPATLEHAEYLRLLGEALEEQAATMATFELPVGSAYIVNNRFTLHGRDRFENRPGFKRTVLRFCGNLK